MGLRRNIVANYVGAGWNALMNVAFVSAYIHQLGPAGYGLIGVFTLMLGLMSLLDLGMAPTVSRELARLAVAAPGDSVSRQLLRGVEGVAAMLFLIVAFAMWAGSAWLAAHWLNSRGLPASDVVFALRVMGVLVGMRFLENVYRSALIGLQQQVALNTVLAFTSTFRNAGAFVIVEWIAPDVRAFFSWQLLASLVTTVAFGAVTYRNLRHVQDADRFSLAPLRAAWRFAAGTMVIASLSIVLGSLDKVMLTRLLSLEAFGYYALAVVVAQVPLGLVTPIAQAFYPRFTQLHVARGADLSQSYHAATQLLTVLIGTATVFLVLLGHPVLMLWLGNPDTVARVESLVAILAIGSMINGLMTLPYFLQLSAGWTSLTIRINLLAILVVTPALFLAVPRFGAIAAAWIWLALNSGYLLLSVPLMHRRLLKGELWAWYLRDVLPPLAAAALVGFLWRVLALPVPSGIVGWCLLTFEGLCMLAAAVMASSYLRDRLRALRRQF